MNDAPMLAAAATLRGATAGRPFEISYDTLRAATNLSDVDHASPSLIITWVSGGRVQKWNGSRWVNVSLAFWSQAAQRTIAPTDRIRWIPPAGATGTRPAFQVQATDGITRSATISQISIELS